MSITIALPSKGRLREQALLATLGEGRWPARNPQQTVADLRAQIAAK